jgi:hypothetical protein
MFTPDTKRRLRSGQGLGRQWQQVNDIGQGARHTKSENVAARDAIAARPSRQLRTPVGGGAFLGEYDPTQDYTEGDTFIISENTIIGGISVIAGYYGVPPAGTDAIGTWAGYIPANPSGNQVPQHPLPAIGAAPNDKFYGRIIVAYC